MLDISDKIIDGRILRTNFACDLGVCKGACCTFPGGTGAPVKDDEIEQIQNAYPAIERFIPKIHRQVVQKQGLFERNSRGTFLRCYNDRACVLVRYEDGIAVCALQHGYLRGLTTFPKPISCHLFPIRADERDAGILRYEEFSECRSALRKGEEEDVLLVDFLRDAVVRAYGQSFHEHMRSSAARWAKRLERESSAE